MGRGRRRGGHYGVAPGNQDSAYTDDPDDLSPDEEFVEQPGAMIEHPVDGVAVGDIMYPSDAREIAPSHVRVDPVPATRHGAFAHHSGTAQADFTIAYNGCTVSYRAHQSIDADDGLFDAIHVADAPVVWK